MEFIPQLGFYLFGGWILVILYLVILTVIMASRPKDTLKRLYDTSEWSKEQLKISKIVKIFFLTDYALVMFLEMKLDSIDTIIGIALYVIGFIGFFIAILNYTDTPADEPVSKGLYKYSRNPQIIGLYFNFIGMTIAVGSYLAIIFCILGIIASHYRIIAEERQCLIQYEKSYQDYMDKIPRYFLFF